MTDGIVWALLHESGATEARRAESTRYMRALSRVMPEAQTRRHEPNASFATAMKHCLGANDAMPLAI
jgi:hypothetical protein